MARTTTRTSRTKLSLAEQYIEGVLEGRIVVGQLVRLAVERHVQDLKTGRERGLWFDRKAAQRVIDFFPICRHSIGEFGGQPFELRPFQAFTVWCVFGWKRADGGRRFREVYEQMARKQGKSTKLAATGTYMLMGDGERGARVYTAATKREQARIIHEEATRMVAQSPALRKRIRTNKDVLFVPDTAARYVPLAADAKKEDGLNAHCGIVDEYARHPTSRLYYVIKGSMRARRQPLMYVITTPGHDRETPCGQMRAYAEHVLRRIHTDDRFFAFVCEPDPGDDWQDEEVCWPKGNPALGMVVSLDDMRAECNRVVGDPSLLNDFMRDYLGIWTAQKNRAIVMEQWDACDQTLNLRALRRLECYGGLDLASKWDMTAFVLVWRLPDGTYAWHPTYWLPEGRLKEYPPRERGMYETWVQEGLVKTTPGKITNYDFIRAHINRAAARFEIEEVAYDPYHATQLAMQLADDGVTMVECRNNMQTMSEPTKHTLAMIREGRIAHGGHRVLRWNASNFETQPDSNGNIKPARKEKPEEKIDGIVAGIMAMSRAILQGADGSPYETRQPLTLQ